MPIPPKTFHAGGQFWFRQKRGVSKYVYRHDGPSRVLPPGPMGENYAWLAWHGRDSQVYGLVKDPRKPEPELCRINPEGVHHNA